jgi:hypothetical protein
MGHKTYYTPLCKDENGHFQVNGATTTNREDSIRLAKMHISFVEGNAEIIEVSETVVKYHEEN